MSHRMLPRYTSLLKCYIIKVHRLLHIIVTFVDSELVAALVTALETSYMNFLFLPPNYVYIAPSISVYMHKPQLSRPDMQEAMAAMCSFHFS